MLKVSALKRRDGFTLDARFETPTPGVVALFGRSGCGKTTTINIIAGLLAADEARIELDGEVLEDRGAGTWVPPERRRIGYVFQDGRLFPHMTVLRNLRYGLTRAAGRGRTGGFSSNQPRAALGRPHSAHDRPPSRTDGPYGPPAQLSDYPAPSRQIELDHVVSLLGLEQLLNRRPHQLSGGERQRVSLGRALLSQPRLLLLDEPLAALDAARRDEVLPYLERLRDNLSIPMVYVSHQFEEVLRLATHVVLLDAGRVLAQGSLSEISLLPALRSIVGPDSVGAVLDGVVMRVDTGGGIVGLRIGQGELNVSVRDVTVGQRLRVQLLARDIILATAAPHGLSVRNQLHGVVASIAEDDEDAMLVTVDVGGANVLSRVTRDATRALNLRVGTEVWALVKAVSTRGHAYRMATR